MLSLPFAVLCALSSGAPSLASADAVHDLVSTDLAVHASVGADGLALRTAPDRPVAARLELVALGRPERLLPVGAPCAVRGGPAGVRLERDGLTEWFRPAARGVEQGFDVAASPAGAGPLLLLLDPGARRVAVAPDGLGASLRGAAGEPVLRYTGLAAWDADGRPLAARMVALAGGAAGDDLALEVEDAGARYPVTIDPVAWFEEVYLYPADGLAQDEFGFSVAIDGDTAVVGTRQSPAVVPYAGAAYVYVRSGGAWTLQQKLVPSTAAVADRFGAAVDVDGDLLVVGAPDADIGGVVDQGAAFVYRRVAGVWTEEAHLVDPLGTQSDHLGHSVGISGETVVLAAPWAAGHGEVSVHTRAGGAWPLQQVLVPLDVAAGDEVGTSVAISGDSVVLGAQSHDHTASWAGAGYVFTRSGSVWTQQAELLASTGVAGDWLGFASAIDGDTVVLGAHGVDTVGFTSGAAYVFERSGSTWTEVQKLVPANTASGDRFGYAVAVSGAAAVVGAYYKSGPKGTAGSVFVYRRSAGTWTEEAQLYGSGAGSGEYFGFSVGASGDRFVAGSPYDYVLPLGKASGGAYVFAGCTQAPAAEVVRLGAPPNPDALRPGLTQAPVIGTTWDPWVDHALFLPGSVFDLLGLNPAPANVPLGAMGTLLCDPLQPLTYFFATPGTSFHLAIPLDCSFVGATVCTQAASIDAGGTVLLTNALDVTVGSF